MYFGSSRQYKVLYHLFAYYTHVVILYLIYNKFTSRFMGSKAVSLNVYFLMRSIITFRAFELLFLPTVVLNMPFQRNSWTVAFMTARTIMFLKHRNFWKKWLNSCTWHTVVPHSWANRILYNFYSLKTKGKKNLPSVRWFFTWTFWGLNPFSLE